MLPSALLSPSGGDQALCPEEPLTQGRSEPRLGLRREAEGPAWGPMGGPGGGAGVPTTPVLLHQEPPSPAPGQGKSAGMCRWCCSKDEAISSLLVSSSRTAAKGWVQITLTGVHHSPASHCLEHNDDNKLFSLTQSSVPFPTLSQHDLFLLSFLLFKFFDTGAH